MIARIALALTLLALCGGRALAEEPLAVTRIAPGVFVHHGEIALMNEANRGSIANIGFVVGDDAVAVIDTGGSLFVGRALLAAVRRVTPLPVRFVINTHMHPDHVFGNAAFRGTSDGGGNPTLVGHRQLPEALATRGQHYIAANRDALGPYAEGLEIVLPDRTVADTMRVDLGNRTLLIRAWPTAHTNNDLTVLDEATATLFAGDLLFMDHLPAIDGSLIGWLAIHDTLAAVPAERVVPGHGPSSAPWPEALAPQRAYLAGLAAALRPLIRRGLPMAEAVATVPPPEDWSLVEEFHRRNVTAAFAELEWE